MILSYCWFVLFFHINFSDQYFNRHILNSFILKEFADNNFKFYEDGRKLSKQVQNTEGKGEILLFPQCFQKTCTADT